MVIFSFCFFVVFKFIVVENGFVFDVCFGRKKGWGLRVVEVFVGFLVLWVFLVLVVRGF